MRLQWVMRLYTIPSIFLFVVNLVACSVTAQEFALNWSKDGSQFWYQTETKSGPEFRVGAVKTGELKPAFDHLRVYRAIEQQFQIPNPSIQRIGFLEEPHAYFVEVQGQFFRVNSLDQSVTKIKKPEWVSEDFRLFRRKARSKDGQRTDLEVHNETKDLLMISWVDRKGQLKPYGEIVSGKKFETSTWAGHVWQLRSADGTPIGYFETRINDRLIINQKAIDNVQRNSPRNPRTATRPTRDTPNDRKRGHRTSREWKTSIRNHNLWLVPKNAPDGAAIQLTKDGNKKNSFLRFGSGQRWFPEDPENASGDVEWSPDGRFLIAKQTKPVTQRQVHYIESFANNDLQPALQSYAYPKPGDELPINRLRLFSVKDGKEIPISNQLFENPFSMRILDWDADSSRFWIYYNQRGHQVLRILEVDAEKGTVRPVVEETSNTFIHYSGDSKYVLEHLPDQQFLWASERSGWNHLYRIDAVTGEVVNAVTSGEFNVRSIEKIDPERQIVWFYAVGIHQDQDPYHWHFCRVHFDGSDFRVLTQGDGTHQVKFEKGDRYLVDTWSRVDQAPITELRDAESGALVAQLQKKDTQSEFGRRPLTTRFTAKGRDGITDIWGIIHWPINFNASARYPVIESIYAGPHDHHVPKQFRKHFGQHRIADAGFIVVQIDGMGTAWRSKKFHDVCFQNLRDAGFPDRIAWISKAAQQYPSMDISRVGIYGGSAGGQNAMAALLWHNDFYSVAVADCGCHDNRMDKIWWNEQWMGWPVEDHYAKNSNMANAHLMEGHLMLTLGETDRNVDPATTTQVVQKLIEANKDFEFVLLPGQGHGAGESQWAARKRLNFFIEHLQ